MQDASTIPDKYSQLQKFGNLFSPVNDNGLLTASIRNTSSKLNSYKSLDSNNHCTLATNRSSQNSQLYIGNRSSCNSTTYSINRSQTVPAEMSSPNHRDLFSHVSPLYVEDFPELGFTSKNQRRDKRQNCMTLGDFLVNQKQKIKPQINRKRIKPTKLILDGPNNKGICECYF